MRLKALLRVRLLGLKASLTGANRSNRKRSKASIIGFSVLMIYTLLRAGLRRDLLCAGRDHVLLPDVHRQRVHLENAAL